MIMKNGNLKNNVNCIVVGDGMVGKSTLALSFTQQKLPDDYVATVFENYAGTITGFIITKFKPDPKNPPVLHSGRWIRLSCVVE